MYHTCYFVEICLIKQFRKTPETVAGRCILFEIQYPMVSSVATGGLQSSPVVYYSMLKSGYHFTVWLFKGDAQFPEWLRVTHRVVLFYIPCLLKNQQIKKSEKTVF
jgi:hypothetical protein